MKKPKQKIDSQRLGMYKKIQVGRRQLPSMNDDDVFRDWLEANFQVRSRKKLLDKQLAYVIDLLAKMGAVFTSGGSNKKLGAHVRPDWIEISDADPYAKQKRAICAIWKKLGYSMTSLETRVKREFGVHSFMWLRDEKHIERLLTDLQKREKSYDKKQITEDADLSTKS